MRLPFCPVTCGDTGDRFYRDDSPTTQQAWADVQRRLNVDSPVTGVVFSKAHYGAWIDLGVGFPALLEIPYVAGLTPERYRADEWCPVGSTVHAFVLGFRAEAGQVYLWQANRPSPAA